jgi:hypothetical protein
MSNNALIIGIYLEYPYRSSFIQCKDDEKKAVNKAASPLKKA